MGKKAAATVEQIVTRPDQASRDADMAWLNAAPGEKPDSIQEVNRGDIKMLKSEDVEVPEGQGTQAQKLKDGKASEAQDTKDPKANGSEKPKTRRPQQARLDRIFGVKKKKRQPTVGTRANPRLDMRTGRKKITTSIHFVRELMVLINEDRAREELTLSDWLMLAAAEKLGLKALPGGVVVEAEGEDEDGEGSSDEESLNKERSA